MKTFRKKVLIGTSGWDYADWQSRFYPDRLKNKLNFYSTKFNTVEINYSFYNLPTKENFKKWHSNSTDKFIFSLKLYRVITHFKKLNLDANNKKLIVTFLKNSQELKEKLGVILIQLPPSFKANSQVIESFLKFLSKKINQLKYKPKTAVEFRHPSWFSEKNYKILKKFNSSLVISHSKKYPYQKVFTANFSYLRFHGPGELFASKYKTENLKKIKELIQKAPPKIKTFFIYFNNDYHGYAVENAEYLKKIL